jgi:uncharacterized membrane protein YraQ (UPF0718 family)
MKVTLPPAETIRYKSTIEAKWFGGLALAALIVTIAYANLTPFANFLLSLTRIDPHTHLGGALSFYFFEAPKVLLLLIGIVFIMGVIQTFVSPERTRTILSGRRLGAGNVLAAGLGIVTPFCSCSAIPLFIGFLQAGVPLGVTFSFLISAPMVNEVALAMLFAMLGWKVAAIYLGLGLSVAIIAGLTIGALRMEDSLEDWVRALQRAAPIKSCVERLTWPQRFESGVSHVREIVGKVWIFILLGIAIGAGIYGYVPQSFMVSVMGRNTGWWSVPIAVLIGVPMYSNAAGMIPIVQALLGKGAALGTTLAFMMSVTGLSAPEIFILRKVLKPRLIATFVGVLTIGIVLVGYVFNTVL